MKIILLRDVAKIGKRYDIKDVPPGYARNFLIPQKSALFATTQEIQRVGEIKKAKERGVEANDASLYAGLETLDGKKITIQTPASEKGSLYAQIGREEIASLIQKQTGIVIPHECIVLPSPLKNTGENTIKMESGKKKSELILTIEGKEKSNKRK